MVVQMHRYGMLTRTTYNAKGSVEGVGATSKACKIAVSTVCMHTSGSPPEGHRLYRSAYQGAICAALDGGVRPVVFKPLSIRDFLRGVAAQRPTSPRFGSLGQA